MRAIETDRLLDLVGAIYETALDPAAMPQALGKLAGALEANVAQWCCADRDSGAVLASVVSQGADPAVHRAYLSRYGAIDPRRRRVEALPDGTVMRCSDAFDERFVSRSEFYQDFYLPAGQRWNMATRYDAGNGAAASLGVSRPLGAPAFEDEAVREFMRIVPHLRKASLLQKRLASRVATGLDAQALLAALPIGGVLLDGQGGVMQANAAAGEPIAELALELGGGFLRFAQPERQAAWLQTVGQVGTERLPRTLTLACPNGTAWRLHLIPLQLVARAADAVDAQLMLAAFERGEVDAAQRQAALRSRFHLTAAQAEVLSGLLEGRSAKQIAQRRRASVNTVRTHVKAIFEKTGCRSQRELIVRLLGV